MTSQELIRYQYNDTGLQLNLTFDLPSLIGVTTRVLKIVIYFARFNTTNNHVYNYGDKQEFTGEGFIRNNVTCFTGYLTGHYQFEISSSNNVANIPAVRCDGGSSGQLRGFVDLTNSQGAQAFSVVWTFDASVDTDIYCTGNLACSDSYPRHARRMYCTGYNCTPLGTYNVSHVVFYGACDLNRDITMNGVDDIYCGGYLTCTNSSISDVFDGVYARGYETLSNGILMDIDGDVVGLGRMVLSGTRISNVENACFLCVFLVCVLINILYVIS